jgi:putative Ca2+/H+ antiporter (TMEM165/GDT1 family)
MDPRAALSAFAAVFPAELPDKTMIATLVLVTRYRQPLAVWAGAASAFALHVVVAVVAGGVLSLLPDAAVDVATATLFATGAVVLWRSSGRADPEEQVSVAAAAPTDRRFAAAAVGTFGVVVLAEWGDLTQLATASIAASTGQPVSVAIGALLALWSVAALAVTAGRVLADRLPLKLLQRFASLVFASLAVVTLAGAA